MIMSLEKYLIVRYATSIINIKLTNVNAFIKVLFNS